jgi:hypothetical protein
MLRYRVVGVASVFPLILASCGEKAEEAAVPGAPRAARSHGPSDRGTARRLVHRGRRAQGDRARGSR